MAMLLRDYVRLNATRSIETPLTLAGAAAAERDAAVMRSLTRGPLAPAAEYWIILGTPLDRRELSERLKMSERAARYFPSNAVIVRRAVFLAFDGQATEARSLLLHAMQSFPHRCKATVLILEQALASDRGAIEPLLALAKHASRETASDFRTCDDRQQHQPVSKRISAAARLLRFARHHRHVASFEAGLRPGSTDADLTRSRLVPVSHVTSHPRNYTPAIKLS